MTEQAAPTQPAATDPAPAPVDPLQKRFKHKLDTAMREGEIVDTLAKAGLSSASIKDAAAAKYEKVRGAISVWTTASGELLGELDEAERELAEFEQTHPRRKSAIAGWLAAAVITLSAIALAVIFTPVWLLLLFLDILSIGLIAAPSEALDGKAHELRIPVLRQQIRATDHRTDIELHLHVMAVLRETINARLESYDTGFRLFDGQGLEQLADHEREISTQATERLAASMATLASGSIGLSGPRGAGKTALIYSFTEGSATLPFAKSRRGFVVAAPVRYDAREFVLHLFARLCEEVLGETGVADMYRRRILGLQVRRRRGAALALGAAGALLLAAGAVVIIARQTAPRGPQQTGIVFLFLGAAVSAAAVFLWQWAGRQRAHSAEGKDTPLRLAEEHLQEIRYQQTLEAGWSGGLQLPLGITFGAASELSLERAVMTLPEVIDRFKRYAASLAANSYWVIGIDELDKMESEEAARRFLNDIKGVFGVQGCYYLVSVSEDAMSSFERRGLPFRDVFDSSFDAVERVGYLTFDESKAVLARRVLGLPTPFHALCHCLSGGLPRDLIRVARELVNEERRQRAATEESGGERSSRLGPLCSGLVRAELEGKVAAAIVAARRAAPAHDREWLLAWLCTDDSTRADIQCLRRRTAQLLTWGGLLGTDHEGGDGVASARDIGLELAAFLYYAGTVTEFFVDSVEERELRAVDEAGLPVLERLARARQYFSLSPVLAWDQITMFRNANPAMVSWGHAGDPSATSLVSVSPE